CQLGVSLFIRCETPTQSLPPAPAGKKRADPYVSALT
ncbi:unnamed protein product, partial [marine sediment metagenome]